MDRVIDPAIGPSDGLQRCPAGWRKKSSDRTGKETSQLHRQLPPVIPPASAGGVSLSEHLMVPPFLLVSFLFCSWSEHLSFSNASSKPMLVALAWFVPTPSGVALPRGEETQSTRSPNKSQHLRNRESVANSQVPQARNALSVERQSARPGVGRGNR